MSPRIEPTRRRFVAGCALGAPLLGGCDRVLSFAAQLLGDGIPDAFDAPRTSDLDPIFHLVSRTSFGPRPGDLEEVRRVGSSAHLDMQLEPVEIDDTACELRAGVIDAATLPRSLLFELPPEQVEVEIARHALLRATYSRRQLFEVMVELWSDHFHVALGKGACRHLLPADLRDVVRAHALGSFRELLGASALSPSMLVYLDGRDNRVDAPGDRPNENYARELFELHTLGVRGGYTQGDVMEAARCMTGFVVKEKWAPGEVEFVPELHDQGAKRVLGHTIPAGGGRSDVDRLLDIVASHPSTARHVASKLCAAFIADDPPGRAVDDAASTFASSGGDIRSTVRAVLRSDAFSTARGAKIKRPFRLVVSALRAVGADTHAKGALPTALGRMGQTPYAWPTPDGYPTRGDAWLGSVLPRFRFGFDLALGRMGGTRIDVDRLSRAVRGDRKDERLLAHLFGRRPSRAELDRLAAPSIAETLALGLSSPAFQRY